MAMVKVLGRPSPDRGVFEQFVADKVAEITASPATAVGIDTRVSVAGGGNPNPLWVEVHSLTDFAKEDTQRRLAQALLATVEPFSVFLEFVEMDAIWTKDAKGDIFRF